MRTKFQKMMPYLMGVLPLLFFTYQFILRLWPGLMMQPIMEQFSIGASEFGVIAAFYYYGYAGLQVPVAMLLDRFSPAKVICAFAIICGLANYLFLNTDNYYMAILSRFLIGAGSAVGFLGVSKVVSQWFSKDRYAAMIGISFSVGLMGAVYGGKPVAILVENYGWKPVALYLSLAAVLIGLLCGVFLKSPTKHTPDTPKGEIFRLQDLGTILLSPAIWILAIANLLMVGALEGFADVWGIPYMMTAYGLAKCDAAELVSFIYVGMLFGGPLLALLSRKIGSFKVIALCGIGMAFAFVCLLKGGIAFEYALFATLFFLIGIMCCYQVIVFEAGSFLVAAKYLGVTVAFLNCMNMMGGSFFHTFIGRGMDLFWDGRVGDAGAKLYSLDAYGYALSILPISAVIGAVMVFYLGFKGRKTTVVA